MFVGMVEVKFMYKVECKYLKGEQTHWRSVRIYFVESVCLYNYQISHTKTLDGWHADMTHLFSGTN
jgi:hypothetical protein